MNDEIKNFGFGINQQNGQFYQQGWVCPKCGGVMSPTQPFCVNCQPKNIQITNTGIMQPIQTENKSISKGE